MLFFEAGSYDKLWKRVVGHHWFDESFEKYVFREHLLVEINGEAAAMEAVESDHAFEEHFLAFRFFYTFSFMFTFL